MILNLQFRGNYWSNSNLKNEFIRFLNQTFGLDLSLWDRKGFWDNCYRPFSYFSGDTLVSNVCIYSMDMTIKGMKCSVAQVSAVGTIPEYRRKGLSQQLMQTAINWAKDKHEFFYLFADKEAFPFYKKSGFRLTDEYKARITGPLMTPRPGAIKLDMQRADHIELVHRVASDREPVSNILGVTNSNLFMFWCLYSLREYIYYIPELDILVLYKREKGMVTIFDIVGKSVPTFAEIIPYICKSQDEAVKFLFMVDKLGLGNIDYIKVRGNGTHLFGNFPIEAPQFIFPLTSHA